MVFRIEVDAKERARLHVVLAGTDRQYRQFADIKVIDFEVEVLLLRVLLTGPLRGLVVVDALERQCRAAIADEFDPVVGGVFIEGPTGYRRVEPGQFTRAAAVDGCPGKASDLRHGPQHCTTTAAHRG